MKKPTCTNFRMVGMPAIQCACRFFHSYLNKINQHSILKLKSFFFFFSNFPEACFMQYFAKVF